MRLGLDGEDLVDGVAGEEFFQHGDGGLRVGSHTVMGPVQQHAGDAVGIRAGWLSAWKSRWATRPW